MRPHYAYFAAYAFRKYFGEPDGSYIRTVAERQNHMSCDLVIREQNEDSVRILRQVYTLRDTLADNVYEVAKALGIKQDDIWTLIAQTEKRFAQERGLI